MTDASLAQRPGASLLRAQLGGVIRPGGGDKGGRRPRLTQWGCGLGGACEGVAERDGGIHDGLVPSSALPSPVMASAKAATDRPTAAPSTSSSLP